jgi:hypothetical protein
MPDGDLIVEYDAEHRQVITAPVTSPADFSIPMVAEGAGLTLKAWFSGSPSPACQTESAPFDAPVKPAIQATSFAYALLACDDVATTLTFDLDYTYQQGTLTYRVDDLTSVTATYSVADKTARKLEGLTFEGIPADGKPHTLHVSFDGANSCVKDYTLPAAPLSPVIDAVKLT